MHKYTPIILVVCIFMLLLAACGKANDPAAKAVENYLTALVGKNANAITTLSCADWESNARLELARSRLSPPGWKI
jgi:hypothetical protein